MNTAKHEMVRDALQIIKTLGIEDEIRKELATTAKVARPVRGSDPLEDLGAVAVEEAETTVLEIHDRPTLFAYMVNAIGASAMSRRIFKLSTPEVRRLVCNMCNPVPPTSIWEDIEGKCRQGWRRVIQEMVAVGFIMSGDEQHVCINWFTMFHWADAKKLEDEGADGFRALAEDCRIHDDKDDKQLPAKWDIWEALR